MFLIWPGLVDGYVALKSPFQLQGFPRCLQIQRVEAPSGWIGRIPQNEFSVKEKIQRWKDEAPHFPPFHTLLSVDRC